MDAKAEICQVLVQLAQKHAIAVKDINHTMDYDVLSDAVYSVESALERELERIKSRFSELVRAGFAELVGEPPDDPAGDP